jgi:hypothetical protein
MGVSTCFSHALISGYLPSMPPNTRVIDICVGREHVIKPIELFGVDRDRILDDQLL